MKLVLDMIRARISEHRTRTGKTPCCIRISAAQEAKLRAELDLDRDADITVDHIEVHVYEPIPSNGTHA